MAGTVQRLIRHVWGFISNPATIENKQQSFNEGDDGAGRDRTQLVAKGPTGTLHTFITVDEIEDYISQEIGSASFGNIYVKVSTFNELKTALATTLAPYLTIYCDDGDGDGLYSSINDGEVIAVNGVKNIIGNGGTALKLLVNEANVNLTFNIDNELRFIDRIDLVGFSPTGSLTITNSGTGVLKISEVKADDDGTSFTLTVTHATDPQKALVEINNSKYTIPNEGVNFDFDLWTGKHNTVRKVKTESINIRTSKNTLIEHRGNHYGIEDQVLSYSEMKQGNFSTGQSSHTITGTAISTSLGDTYEFYKMLFSRYYTGSVFKSVFSIDIYDGSPVNVLNIYDNGDFDFIKMNFDTVTDKLTVDGTVQAKEFVAEANGKISMSSPSDPIITNSIEPITNTLPMVISKNDGQTQNIAVTIWPQDGSYIGSVQFYGDTFDINSKKEGACSFGGEVFAPVLSSEVPIFSTTGSKRVFASDYDGEFFTKTINTDKKELSSFSTASTGEISGLTMPINLDGDYFITFKCNVTLLEIADSSPYLEIGIYNGLTKIDTLKTSSTTTSGNSTIRTMLSSSFIGTLTGGQNLRFVIDSVNSSPSVSDVKVSMREIV